MKRLVVLMLMILLTCQMIMAQETIEQIAKDIINAYKTSDVNLLKKHASGMLLPAINENFFEDKQAKEIAVMVNGWDGTIKEIRYNSENIMNKNVTITIVYFKMCADEEQICAVLLSSLDNSEWKALGFGISTVEKVEFENYSLEMESMTSAPAKVDHREYTIEMASGEIVKDPSTAKLQELLTTLDDDNFFITLSGNDGFIQAAYSKDGFSVEYRDEDGYFGATGLLSPEETSELFVKYIDKVNNWKETINWESME
ncbi:MAG: hypothetical protein RAP70_11685 [Candidatus Celaenobacter antarcticus]|nr:hypothetical protein [Candidatus Tenebribacter davisii]MDP8315709.1 hypothetical protein [Candidatus Celaenobacter antarcticus]